METWDDILTAHGPAAYRAAWRVLGHAADAEDAVQDALVDGLRLFRRGGVACWPALLRKLCVRRALDRLRRRRPVVPATDRAALGGAPDEQAAADELEARFRRALTALAPREAEVFGLHYFADLDNPQIAAQLDLTSEAVAAALYKARSRLRAILFPEGDEVTAELDPLDAAIDRIRRSEPPADGWPRARRRAARRRLRRPAFALAAAAVVVLTWWAVPPAPLAGWRGAPAADVASAPEARMPDPKPMAAPKTDGLPPAAGGSMAGIWRTPRLAVASTAPVFVCTGGAAPIRMGGTVPAGTVGERVHVWNWDAAPESRVLPAGVAVKGAFTLTPDGAALLTTDGRTVDLATGKEAALPWWGNGPAGLKLRPAWATFNADGKTLLTFEHDEKVGTARLIDYPAGTERTRIGGLWWAASKAAFSADGKTVVLFGSDAHLRSFDAATGKEKVRFAPGFENTIRAIAVSPDGSRVAGCYGKAVRVWDAATGKLVCEPKTEREEPDALAFSPDGKRLAGGGSDPLVLWDAADGTLVRRYPTESRLVGDIRFDPAGPTITTVKGFYIHGNRDGREVTVYPVVQRWRVDGKE